MSAQPSPIDDDDLDRALAGPPRTDPAAGPPPLQVVLGHPGRDASGRYLPGHKSIGGRPKMPTLRRIVTERAKAGDVTIDDALNEVFKSLLAAARDGDTAASKLLLDHLCEREQQLDAGLTLRVVTNADGGDES